MRVAAELERQVGLGYFDSAIAGTAEGLVASVGAARGDSLFEVASVSKTFTHLLAALLWQEGRLDIDAPFVRYLPDHVLAKKGTDITVRDLAAHVSGFTNGWMGRAGIYSGKWPYADDAAYERAVLSQLPEFPRRTRCAYACHNTILLGFIVERICGMDLDAAARRYVWGPLGMTGTTWKNVPADDPRLVQIYTKGPCPLGTKGDENARGCTRPPGWSDRTIAHGGYTGQLLAIDPKEGRSAIVLTNLRLTDAKGRSQAYEDRRALAGLLDE